MPAIDLSRLKTQSASLVDKFNNPDDFLKELNTLLRYYTNQTMRQSLTAKRMRLPTHNTPPPVIRQIERDLAPLADRYPSKALILANELWKIGFLETRLLSASIIGMIPPSDAISLLARLPEWLEQTHDQPVFQALLIGSFSRIRRENPTAFFLILEDWLNSPRPNLQRWGMLALMPLITNPGFQNLPAVLRILQPAVLNASFATQIELQSCLRTLEELSPNEINIYLRDLLTSHPTPKSYKIFNRMLPTFSSRSKIILSQTLNQIKDKFNETK